MLIHLHTRMEHGLKIDRALQNHFTMRRGTAYWKKPPKKHRNYANGSRLVFGLGIDKELW